MCTYVCKNNEIWKYNCSLSVSDLGVVMRVWTAVNWRTVWWISRAASQKPSTSKTSLRSRWTSMRFSGAPGRWTASWAAVSRCVDMVSAALGWCFSLFYFICLWFRIVVCLQLPANMAVSSREVRRPNGLYMGHAYSITALAVVGYIWWGDLYVRCL